MKGLAKIDVIINCEHVGVADQVKKERAKVLQNLRVVLIREKGRSI